MKSFRYIFQLSSPAKSHIGNGEFSVLRDDRWEVKFLGDGQFRMSNLTTGHFKELSSRFISRMDLKNKRMSLTRSVGLSQYKVHLF